MSLKSEPKDAGSTDDKGCISGANSVADEDGVERPVKDPSELRYSHDFLLKLQKSKLSKKPPECMERLRQEGILRETWRTDRSGGLGEKDADRDEFPAALTKPPPSFRGGCKVDKAVVPETVNTATGNGNKKTASTKVERRAGSGRLAFKDRDSDYGYPQEKPARRIFEHIPTDHKRLGRFDGSSLGRDDEPEWFTEGPTSQTDTIELGGFEESTRKAKTPSPVVKKDLPEAGIDYLKELREGGSPSGNHQNNNNHKKESPMVFGQYFGQQDDEDEPMPQPQGGSSRFMSKVFSKAFEDTKPHDSSDSSANDFSKDELPESKSVLELLDDSATPSNDVFRDFFGLNQTSMSMMSSARTPIQAPMQNQGPSINALQALLKNSSSQNNSDLGNSSMDVDKSLHGKNILDLLLSSVKTHSSQPPPPPLFAKSVEELEADLKLESARKSGFYGNSMVHHSQQPVMSQHQKHERMIHGNGHHMERPSMNMMNELSRDMNLQSHGSPMGHFVSPPRHHPHHQQHHQSPIMASNQAPAHPSSHLYQQQQQPNNTHNYSSSSIDIMRMLMDSSPMMERGDPSQQQKMASAIKQDLRNVPTQVLLQEKAICRDSPPTGPRPIVKSNKAPMPPSMGGPASETSENLIQKMFPSYEQTIAQQHSSQQQYLQHQQHQQAHQHSRQQNYFGSYNGNPHHVSMDIMGHNSHRARPVTGNHHGVGRVVGNEKLTPGQDLNNLTEDMLAKWFGHLRCNQQPSLPVPGNVVLAEELESQNNHHHRLYPQANPT